MSTPQYGRPIYDSNGRIKGYTADHDGDGTYDDFVEVVSDPISDGDGFTTHVADHDGDGTYDDYNIFVTDHVHEDNGHDNDHDNGHNNTQQKSSSAHQLATTHVAVKNKSIRVMKVVMIIALAMIAYSVFSGIATFIIALLYKLAN